MQPLCEESSMLIFQVPKCPQGILLQSLPVMYHPGFVMMYYYHYSAEKLVERVLEHCLTYILEICKQ